MKNKLKLSVAILLGLGLGANNILENNHQNNLNERYEEAIQKKEYDENPETKLLRNPMTGEETNKKEYEKVELVEVYENEQDIYDLNDINDMVYYVPVKAFEMESNGIAYTGLADGNGSFYTTKGLLKGGKNYIILYSEYSDRILDVRESTFEFSYELQFELFEDDFRFELENDYNEKRLMVL